VVPSPISSLGRDVEERQVPCPRCSIKGTAREAVVMKDFIKLKGYAEDCRRLAKVMKPEHKATLLEIADAWDQCAEEAERKTGKGQGKMQ
jgi:hypothetical protein